MRRRRFLAVFGTSATAALAGCGSKQPRDISTVTTKTKTETETATATQIQKQTTTQPPTEQTTTQPSTENEQEKDEKKHDGRPSTKYQLAVHDTRENGYPVWVDQHGRMYGRYGTEVMVSDDWYQTTKTLFSFQGIDNEHVQMVIVPPSGRIIVAVGGRGETGGRIYRLTNNLDKAKKLYQFEYGRVLNSMGHAVYENIVVLSCYALSDFEEDQYANEVILSTDGGKSFDRILEVPLKTTDAANLHIHDVEYDPYADRIWVVVGDNGNSQMYWSDDLGHSWQTIAEQGDVTMLTQIAAFKDCVAFGTDGYPEGIIRWERQGPNDEPAGVDDLNMHVQIETDQPDDGKMEMYARSRWHIREADGRELCLMAFGYSPMNETATDSVVLASADGDIWYELYRTESRETLLTNVLGPLSMDSNPRTIVSDSNQPPGYQIDATVPKFW
jgi:hypothetical protein